MTMADLIEILCVRAADGGARLILTLECEIAGEKRRETLSVLTARMSRVPQKGEIDASAFAFFHREHALCAALAMGLRSLPAGGGSCLQLRQKLCGKGVPRDVAEDAVQTLCEKGYLNERESALAAAEADLRKLWGDRRILADLRAKGYDEQALFAVRELLAGKDGAARLVRLLQKRHFDMEDPDKLIASLMRYGYTRAEIRTALREIMGE
jgi:SOS response regulatory protein OraA/RecX